MWLLAFLLVSLICRGGGYREGSPDSRFPTPQGGFAPTLCPSKGVTTVPAFASCDSYIDCDEGFEAFTECPRGLLYNPDRANDTEPCDLPSNVETSVLISCHPPLQSFLPCPPDGIATIESSSGCDKYYSCVSGSLELKQCPSGLLYSPDPAAAADPCSPPANYPVDKLQRCYGAFPSFESCPEEGVTTIESPNGCEEYSECVEGVTSPRTCPAGLVYNPARANDSLPCDPLFSVTVSRLLQCVGQLADLLAASTTPSPSPPGTECRGLFPHHLPGEDDQCHSFYQCRDGVALRRECPDELLYNARAPENDFPCNYPENVVCGASLLPPPPLSPSLPPPPPPPLPPQPPQHDKKEKRNVFNFYVYK